MANLNAITWKKTGQNDVCLCQNTNIDDCGSSTDNSYQKADCSCAKKRRKRSMIVNETISALSIFEVNETKVKSDRLESLTRHKRSIDTTRERTFTCESLWSGTAGYWNYDYKTPEKCFSKFRSDNTIQILNHIIKHFRG